MGQPACLPRGQRMGWEKRGVGGPAAAAGSAAGQPASCTPAAGRLGRHSQETEPSPPPGTSIRAPDEQTSKRQRAASQQQLGHLHRVERGALLDLVAAHKDVEALGIGAGDVAAHPPHIHVILWRVVGGGGGGEGRGRGGQGREGGGMSVYGWRREMARRWGEAAGGGAWYGHGTGPRQPRRSSFRHSGCRAKTRRLPPPSTHTHKHCPQRVPLPLTAARHAPGSRRPAAWGSGCWRGR